MTETPKDIFKGRDSPYIGIGIIAGTITGIGWAFSSIVMLVLGGALLGGGFLGYLLGKYKKIKLLAEGIQIFRGQIGQKKLIEFAQVESIYIKREREDVGNELMTYDLETIDNWKEYKYLAVHLTNKKTPVLMPQNEFGEEEFRGLVQNLQRTYLEAKGSALQKANQVYQKTLRYIHDDRRMLSELKLSLQEAYRSVFRPFETLYKKETVAELDQNPQVLFHAIKQGNVLIYFKKGAYLPNIKEASAHAAKNLIEAAENNLEIVKTRLKSHQEVKQKLERLKSQLQSRERLKSVASKLDKLQQKNMNKSLEHEDLAHEAEVLAQIELLTEHIHNTETLEKSLVLKEHIELFRENVQGEEMLLKELNKRLE